MNGFSHSLLVCIGMTCWNVVSQAGSPTTREIQELHTRISQLQQIDPHTPAGQIRLLESIIDAMASRSIRLAAIEHLAEAQVHSTAVQQAALQLIGKDTDKYVCQSVTLALHNLGIPAEASVPVLLRALDDNRSCSNRGCSSGTISYAAIRALGRYGPAAASAIGRLEWEIDPANKRHNNRDVARYTLGRIAPWRYPFFAQGEAAIGPLVAQVRSDIAGRRLCAAERLLELHAWAAPATAELEEMLEDENLHVRMAAAAALLAMRPHPTASTVLANCANSTNRVDRLRILDRLSRYELKFDDSDVLLQLLGDSDPHIRSKAAIRLVKTGRNEAEAFDAIVALYNLNTHHSQVVAMRTFGIFRAEILLPAKVMIEDAAGRNGSVGYLARRVQREKFRHYAPEGRNELVQASTAVEQ